MNLLEQLNKTLSLQLATLSSSDLKGEELEEEIKRNKAIVEVSKQVVDVAQVTLEAVKLDLEYGNKQASDTLMLEVK